MLFSKDVNLSGTNFVYDALYQRPVNRHNSSVHVPIDIYDKGIVSRVWLYVQRSVTVAGCY